MWQPDAKAQQVAFEEAVPEAGVPLSVPVPFPLSLNVTPLGSAPVSPSEGVGFPVAVTVKLPAVPTENDVLFALVIAGAWFTFVLVNAAPACPQAVRVYVVCHIFVAATLVLFSLSANGPSLVAL